MDMEMNKFKTLGEYLKSRRNRLQPEAAGIRNSYSQRRTPGLRREEVAVLAGVSTTYYTWLEQGREVTASRDIMESIGRALQLTQDEWIHLFELWNPGSALPIPSISIADSKLSPQWRDIIGQLNYPSFITNERSEVLAWNNAAAEVIANFSLVPDSGRIMLRMLFMDQGLRRRMINWEEFAQYSVAVFRTYYDIHRNDPWYKKMVEQLMDDSPEFAGMWQLHNIQGKRVNRVVIQNLVTGCAVTYDINSVANLADHPGLHICIYTPLSEYPFTEAETARLI